ncbi:MAG: LPS translocon maturation chaperone LptM [Steroidobacteraceae bacterium]
MSGAAATTQALRAGLRCLVLRGVLAAACTFLIAGCGQKGPLYLPQRTGTVVTRPAPAAASPSRESVHSSSTSASSASSSASSSSAPSDR